MGWHFAPNTRSTSTLHIPESIRDIECAAMETYYAGRVFRRSGVSWALLAKSLRALPCDTSVARVDKVGDRVSAKTKSGNRNCLMEITRTTGNLDVIEATKPAMSTIAAMSLKCARALRFG